MTQRTHNKYHLIEKQLSIYGRYYWLNIHKFIRVKTTLMTESLQRSQQGFIAIHPDDNLEQS